MPTGGEQRVHEDRDRAESFGSIAAAYDRYRPGFPPALIDDLAARIRPGAPVLDVGCGTGKAARLLAERGFRVLGVEIDERMAAVARSHGLAVEVAPFERWDDRGRRFALLTCAQAWHWIDPVTGPRRADDVLEPGGTIALFWNYGQSQPELQRALDRVYARLEPDLADSVVHRAAPPHLSDDVRAEGRFEEIEERRYRRQEAYSADQWVSLIGTHSDHLRLRPDRRARLFEAVSAAVEAHGGAVIQQVTTYLLLGRRVGDRVAG
jgi:SAM-dependent methyltransferase